MTQGNLTPFWTIGCHIGRQATTVLDFGGVPAQEGQHTMHRTIYRSIGRVYRQAIPVAIGAAVVAVPVLLIAGRAVRAHQAAARDARADVHRDIIALKTASERTAAAVMGDIYRRSLGADEPPEERPHLRVVRPDAG